MSLSPTHAFALTAAAALLPAAASADLIGYETFLFSDGYPSGNGSANLQGKTTGTGFLGDNSGVGTQPIQNTTGGFRFPSSRNAGSTFGLSGQAFTVPSLSYTDGSGNELVIAGPGDSAQGQLATPGNGPSGAGIRRRDLDEIPNGQDVFLSALINLDNEVAGTNTQFSFTGTGSNAIDLTSVAGGGGTVGVSGTGLTDGPTGDTFSAGTNLIVLALNDATDTFSYWINPDLSGDGTNPDASFTGSGVNFTTGNNDGFALTQQKVDGQSGVASFDEIRLGTTFADVTPFTPVPEPGSLGLAAAGGLLLLRRFRRIG